MTLGERIKKARKGKMTQAELAEQIGVHEITLRRWELGERSPDADVIPKIAEVLGVSVTYLMGVEGALPEAQDVAPTKAKVIERTSRTAPGRLIYDQDGRHLDLPDTPENRELFAMLVEKMLNASAGAISA